MVKKLFKHEFLFYARILPFVYAIVLTFAVATRIIYIFDSDTTAYKIIAVFFTIICGFSILAAFIFTFAMAIVRFYKNLFTNEGYLSFTLPVTAEQHIAVKAVTAMAMHFATLLVVLVSSCILLSGEPLTKIWYDIEEALQLFFEYGTVHEVLFVIEYVLILIIASFSSFLMYYTFICIGQLAKKNRILAAVGAYFAYSIIMQVLATVLSIVFAILASTEAFYEIFYWAEMHPYPFLHITLCSGILLSALFALMEFMLIRWIMANKLNLE